MVSTATQGPISVVPLLNLLDPRPRPRVCLICHRPIPIGRQHVSVKIDYLGYNGNRFGAIHDKMRIFHVCGEDCLGKTMVNIISEEINS